MDKLEKFYNTCVVQDDEMPAFSVLNEQQKARLKNSLGFAFFMAGEALSDFTAAFKRAIPNLRRR